MRASERRILTTHAGSLCRPADVTEALRAQSLGEPYDDAAFAAILSPAVTDVVREQAEAGIDIPSDGEFGKTMWTGYITQRLSGIGPAPQAFRPRVGKDAQDFADFYSVYDKEAGSIWIPPEIRKRYPDTALYVGQRAACTGPVAYTGREAIERDINNFKAALAANNVDQGFLPLAAPASVEVTVPNMFYPDDESYLSALAAALNQEYRAVVDAGLILQVDDACIPRNYDRQILEGRSLQEYLAHSALRIDALNEALRGIPEDRVRYHICWGSWAGPHTTDVPLRDIIDLVLRVNAQAYCFEAANPRHEYEWTVWEDIKLPAGKIIVPGVVTHSTNVVEHPETVAQRIERYARLVGPERVIAGTDCGFSQGWSMPRTHPSIQWAKLRALSEGAALASSRLFTRSSLV